METTPTTTQTVPEALRTLSRHLGDLSEQLCVLANAIEHRHDSPDFLCMTLRDLRTACTHVPYTYTDLLEGEDDA